MKFNFTKKMYSELVNQYVKEYKNSPDVLLDMLNAQYGILLGGVTDTSYPLNNITYDTYNAMCDAYGKIKKVL
mgnify:CR=1 FL=1